VTAEHRKVRWLEFVSLDSLSFARAKMLRREPPVFGSGALAQIFGSKSEGRRGIVVPQCALLMRVSYFLSNLVPLLSGAIFLGAGSHS
jgi:hypothetical protein